MTCVLIFWSLLPLTSSFVNLTETTQIYTLSLHDALPILPGLLGSMARQLLGRLTGGLTFAHEGDGARAVVGKRSEEHTSELQSLTNLVCRLLLEKKKSMSATTRTSGQSGPRCLQR